jgi:hypothetical protein
MTAGAGHGFPGYQLPRQRLAIPSESGGDVHYAGNRHAANVARCPARVVKGTHDVRARGLPQFPVTLDLKTGLNFAAFCQASLPAGISRDAG